MLNDALGGMGTAGMLASGALSAVGDLNAMLGVRICKPLRNG